MDSDKIVETLRVCQEARKLCIKSSVAVEVNQGVWGGAKYECRMVKSVHRVVMWNENTYVFFQPL